MALVVAVVALVQLRRDPEKRAAVRDWLDERSDNAGWRPSGGSRRPRRTVGRPAGTIADRATRFASSSFGLELVTSLTLLAVGALAFGLLGMLIEEHPVPRIDAWAFDVADPLQTPMLVDVAKVVTALGAFPTVALAALATAIWALARRGRKDAAALIAGLLLTWVAVHVAKDAYDRPRPWARWSD